MANDRSLLAAVAALAACSSSTAHVPTCCAIVELRQYTLHPGQRDTLIALIDRELVEPQEAAGMRVLGQFRDLDRPDRFVWLRGFADMPSRARALETFYKGPTWKAHSRAANATMVDSTNVLLLRPLHPDTGFAVGARTPARPTRHVVAHVYSFPSPPTPAALAAFDRALVPRWTAAGASLLGRFATEPAANTFPALPVREGEHVYVVFASFPDSSAYERARAALSSPAPSELLRLSPTTRSLVGR